MADRMRRGGWLFLVAEGLLIVCSVLLALALEAWWDGRKQHAEAAQALVRVRAEIADNRREAETAYAYHQQVIAAYTAALESAPPEEDETAVEWLISRNVMANGLAPPILNSVAWETARDGGALSRWDDELEAQLRRTYFQQARGASATFPELARAFFSPDAHDAARTEVTLRRIQAMIREFTSQEGALVSIYGGTLAVIDGSET